MYRLRTTFLTCLLALLYIVMQAQETTDGNVARKAIAEIALEICPNISGNYDYYVSNETVSDPTANGSTVEGRYWMVFVDMAPLANWDHPCKYIYIKENSMTADGTTIVEDSNRPPRGIKMSSLIEGKKQKVLRAGKSRMPRRTAANGGNKYADNTYAVIISGGANPENNYIRYWNDCSFIYSALAETHGVPKQNIKVVMAGGNTDEPNQNWSNNAVSPDLKQTDCDLDGDGIDDIEYPATIPSLDLVFEELKNKLTEKDHLFVFVTDHGGKDEITDSAYIYLWDNCRLTPKKFASYFKEMKAGYISFLLGQCFSGGFVDDLKGDNRIIATACGEDEESYACEEIEFDEFLYHYTAAINGSDAYGNMVGDGNGSTLKKAFEYAVAKDSHAGHKYAFGRETPTFSLLENTTAEELAFNSIPNAVDLYIGSFPYEENNCFWNSDALWARYYNDAAWNEESQSEKCKLAGYGAVRVSNRGVKPYTGDDLYVSMFWTKPYINIPVTEWLNKSNNYEVLDSYKIIGTIAPGETRLFEMKADPNVMSSFLDHSFYDSYTYFADIHATGDGYMGRPMHRPYEDLSSGHKKLLACKNEIGVGNKSMICSSAANAATTYRLEIVEDSCNVKSIFENAELRINNTNITLNGDNGVSLSENASVDKNNDRSIIINGDARICGIPSSLATFVLDGAFWANSQISGKTKYKVHAVLYDEKTNKCIGGMTYKMSSKRRPAITVDVVGKDENGVAYLVAENVSEKVGYSWMDKDGILIGTTEKVRYTGGDITLRLTAMSDGAIAEFDCSDVQVADNVSIEKIQDGFSVKFKEPVEEETTIKVATISNMSDQRVYKLSKGEKQKDVNTNGMSVNKDSYYSISVFQKNTCISNKKVK